MGHRGWNAVLELVKWRILIKCGPGGLLRRSNYGGGTSRSNIDGGSRPAS